jgi:hypothetical protein
VAGYAAPIHATGQAVSAATGTVVIADFDRAIQFSRTLMMDREAPEYRITRFRG